MSNFKDIKNKSALSTRWAQMSRQEQVIEQKKIEIQARQEAHKQAAALAAQVKLANPSTTDEQESANVFSNDGSFMNQFKALLDKQQKEKEAKENEARQIAAIKDEKFIINEDAATEAGHDFQEFNDDRKKIKKGNQSKDRNRRWTDKGRDHSPINEERNYSNDNNNIPSLMHMPIMPPDDKSSGNHSRNDQESDYDDHESSNNGGPNPSSFMMPRNDMGPPMMGPNGPHQMPPGPPNMPPFMGGPPNFPLPPNFMGPNGPMPHNMCGPNRPMPPPFYGPPFPGGPMMGPNGPPMMGPNGPPMMGPNGPPMMGPNGPPMMGPNRPPMMGPNRPPMMGLNGPPMMGLNGPPMMGPNGPPMMGPNGQPMMGPNGPPMMGPNGPPMMGPNGPPMMGLNGPPMMGPNGPNSMMQLNNEDTVSNSKDKSSLLPPLPPDSMISGSPKHMMGPPNAMTGPNMGPLRPPHSMMGPPGSINSMMRPPNSMLGPPGPPLLNSMGPPGQLNSIGPPSSQNSMTPPGSHDSMGSKGPPNTKSPLTPMLGPNNPSFRGTQPEFGSSGNNFPNNMTFLSPNMSGSIPESKTRNQMLPDNDNAKLNKPPPPPMQLNNIPIPNDLDQDDIPALHNTKVSSDMFPPSVHRAASEVARNGDQWENVLVSIHKQDQNLWFLHNKNSDEYKDFRDLVYEMRMQDNTNTEVKPEDKYEPEFSLEDDDSYEGKPFKEDMDSYHHSNSSQGDSSAYWQQQNSYKREQNSSQSDEEVESNRERRKRKKKSRWGDDPPVDVKPPGVFVPPVPGMPMLAPPMPPMPGMMPPMPGMGSLMHGMGPMPGMPPMPNMGPGMPPMPQMPPMPGAPLLGKIDGDGIKLTTVNKTNQALMQYAMTNYGSTNLNPEEWKKCEDNFKLNLLYQDMLKKRLEVERLSAAGKHKYEYDSDEDTAEGTWEHKLRSKEMNATEKWATELTKQASGKHHIGDFLPPEELKNFMEKYSAVKSGKEPDLSDYKEYKLKEDNVGFKMLQKLGWNEGQGLGAEGTGIVNPINKSNQSSSNLGLGSAVSDNVSPDDDEFDAYRKRMMLAYRFRPNPLNNPRRPYY